MQLVAYGAQDIYLTGQPQITFFKAVYRRHTNFAMESVQQTINGTPALGQQSDVLVSRNGDLILGAHVQLDNVGAPTVGQDMWSYQNFLLFNTVEIEIGGSKIDLIYGDWMALYAELVYRKGYDTQPAVADGDGIGSDTLGTALNNTKVLASGGSIYIPLLFYFNNNPGLAVPLIALQYHEVRFRMLLNTANILTSTAAGLATNGNVTNLVNGLGSAANVITSVSNMQFYVDYAYLDTTERRKFAQNAHEYLISQHQRIDQNATVNTTNVNLSSLNHPVKYLAWRFWQSDEQLYLACNSYNTAKVTINGSDRMSERPSNYFENMQVHQFWPCGGNQLTYAAQGRTLGVDSGKWSVYSFAIRPAEHQPSGTCNFSRIDTSNLVVTNPTASTGHFTLHAENYNVLRIMSGMGGLAYSN